MEERVWTGNEVKNTGPIVLTAEAERRRQKVKEYAIDNLDLLPVL